MEQAPKEKENKPRMSLLPWGVLKEVSKVYEYGTKKYHENSWRKGFSYSDIFDALNRHLTDWWEGEDDDPESGLNHLLHASFNVLTLVYLVLWFTGKDDRPRIKMGSVKLPDENEAKF